MRRIVLPSLLVAGLFSGSVAQAAFDTYVEFKGGDAPKTEGESVAQGFEHQIEVYSFSWGLSNPVSFQSGAGGAGAGKVSISSFNFMKKMDKASPSLFTTCASGKHYDEVVVKLRRAGGKDSQVFVIYTFKNVFVESQQWSGSSGGDDVPTESVSIAFGAVKMEYTPADASQPVAAGWDVMANKPLP